MIDSNYVLCAAPLTAETDNVFDKETNENKNSVFINVGRGQIVNENTLIAVLKDNNGGLKGAGLNVFATVPIQPDSEL
jgi:phosphoglycerate dehydrogenase-like enzyme